MAFNFHFLARFLGRFSVEKLYGYRDFLDFFFDAGRGERGDPSVIQRGKEEKKNFLVLSGKGKKIKIKSKIPSIHVIRGGKKKYKK